MWYGQYDIMIQDHSNKTRIKNEMYKHKGNLVNEISKEI